MTVIQVYTSVYKCNTNTQCCLDTSESVEKPLLHVNSDYYTAILNAVERSVHLHGPPPSGELFFDNDRC